MHGCTAHQHTFAQDVADGLAAPQKWLPPKYFYDERGSQLYEQICALPEYYPYRAEQRFSAPMPRRFMPRSAIWRWWSSAPVVPPRPVTCSQPEWAGRPFRYCPVDISREVLQDTANRLLQEYSHVEIRAMHADFAGQAGGHSGVPTGEESRGLFRVQSGELHACRKRRVPPAHGRHYGAGRRLSPGH